MTAYLCCLFGFNSFVKLQMGKVFVRRRNINLLFVIYYDNNGFGTDAILFYSFIHNSSLKLNSFKFRLQHAVTMR